MHFGLQKYNGILFGILTAYCLFKIGKFIDSDNQAYKNDIQSNLIFFIESNDKREFFDEKQLCSIESAAKHNPNSRVNVMTIKAIAKDPYKKLLVHHYQNLNFEFINLTGIFMGTPFQDWWINDKVTKINDYYRMAHLSDAIRLALLYKKGGLYTDIDTITLRSFDLFYKYSAFFQGADDGELINSFMHMPKEHSFIKYLMESFVNEYDPNDWSKNGPNLIMKHLPIYCNMSASNLVIDRISANSKCDIILFPKRYAYSLHWTSVGHFFESNHPIYARDFIDAYSLHFHSKMSGGHKPFWNSSNIFEFFANHNCPLVNDLSRSI
jgi:hypothetical protein